MPSRPPSHRPPRLPTPDRRPTATARGYDAYWRKLRRLILSREPLCRACAAEGRTEAAAEVDHIVPLARGGTHAESNLQPLCKYHHSLKTATEDGGFGRQLVTHGT